MSNFDDVLVSVVMANYNTDFEFLTESINSILNQTHKYFELIIVDDGSTNGSYEFIKNNFKDDRIVLLKNEKNSGQPYTRNRAFDIAKGKYIAIMDSDDISLPNRLETEVEYMENNQDLIVCGSWCERFGMQSEIVAPVITDFELYRCCLIFNNNPCVIHSTSMLRKSMIEKYNVRYDKELLNSQDYGMWVECSKHGRIDIIKKVLVKYRMHGSQITETSGNKQKRFALLISNRQIESLKVKCGAETEQYRYSIVTSQKDLLNMEKWLLDIVKQNKKLGIYNSEALCKCVEKIYGDAYYYCLNNTGVSNYIFLILFLFFFGKKLSRRLVIKKIFKIGDTK